MLWELFTKWRRSGHPPSTLVPLAWGGALISVFLKASPGGWTYYAANVRSHWTSIVQQDGEGFGNRAPRSNWRKRVCLAFGKTNLRRTWYKADPPLFKYREIKFLSRHLCVILDNRREELQKHRTFSLGCARMELGGWAPGTVSHCLSARSEPTSGSGRPALDPAPPCVGLCVTLGFCVLLCVT